MNWKHQLMTHDRVVCGTTHLPNHEIFTTLTCMAEMINNRTHPLIMIATSSHAKRYFTTLALSTTGSTCNPMSLSMLQSFLPDADLKRSPYCLYPYGNMKPLEPEGQVNLVCERQDTYVTLTFQILSDSSIRSKPALLSGSYSERLGLITVHADEPIPYPPRWRPQMPNTKTSQGSPTVGCSLASCRNDSRNKNDYGLQPSATTPWDHSQPVYSCTFAL